jgi:hypothetical protein
MHTCTCSVKDTYYARMKFSNGDIHYREVCRVCGGNARGNRINVGVRELLGKGIDPHTLPFVPEEQTAAPSESKQRGLFDDLP